MLTFTYAYTFIFLNDLLTLVCRFWFILGETGYAFHSDDTEVSEEPMFSKWLLSTLQLQKRPELDRRSWIVHPRGQQAENLWKPGLSRGRIWCNHASCCVHGESSWTFHKCQRTTGKVSNTCLDMQCCTCPAVGCAHNYFLFVPIKSFF